MPNDEDQHFTWNLGILTEIALCLGEVVSYLILEPGLQPVYSRVLQDLLPEGLRMDGYGNHNVISVGPWPHLVHCCSVLSWLLLFGQEELLRPSIILSLYFTLATSINIKVSVGVLSSHGKEINEEM